MESGKPERAPIRSGVSATANAQFNDERNNNSLGTFGKLWVPSSASPKVSFDD